MSTNASQIAGVLIVRSTVCSGPDQRIHQSYASLASVREIHWWAVDSSHKAPVTPKMFHLMTWLWMEALINLTNDETRASPKHYWKLSNWWQVYVASTTNLVNKIYWSVYAYEWYLYGCLIVSHFMKCFIFPIYILINHSLLLVSYRQFCHFWMPVKMAASTNG